jgi:hypothetical protein
MHLPRRLAPVLLLTLMACAHEPGHAVMEAARPLQRGVNRFGRSAAMKLRLTDAHLIQRTCALFVSLRSHAWKEQVGFGQEMEGGDVRWNTCPGGTMVACVVVPTANGDSVVTGLPMP